ncbi:MAG: DUF952 domain-containing protein [Aeromicrobium sp.]|nr:DUF952 domain-containing protein [Burkholderiales bacterium]
MIYRITTPEDWQRAQQQGHFASPDLAAEGFIHCSEYAQILRTANKYFASAVSLRLLEIDDAQLGVTLVREDLSGGGTFPHVYAPIALSAVQAVHTLSRNADRVWCLPTALQTFGRTE